MFLLHKFAIPSISATLSVGLDTHSIKIIFVFFLISDLTESIFVGSANDVCIPNLGKSSRISLNVRPYNWLPPKTWSPKDKVPIIRDEMAAIPELTTKPVQLPSSLSIKRANISALGCPSLAYV